MILLFLIILKYLNCNLIRSKDYFIDKKILNNNYLKYAKIYHPDYNFKSNLDI